MSRPIVFGSPHHPYRVLFTNGGYRSFLHYETFNAYLLSIEDQGLGWKFVDEKTALLVV